MPLPSYFKPPRQKLSLAKALEGMTREQVLAELRGGARFVTFQYVFSFILITERRSSKIFFLKSNEKTGLHSLPYSLVTFALGWWGFPYGLVYTPQAIYRNFRGGTDITTQMLASLGLTL
jgi:hypothetical protein